LVIFQFEKVRSNTTLLPILPLGVVDLSIKAGTITASKAMNGSGPNHTVEAHSKETSNRRQPRHHWRCSTIDRTFRRCGLDRLRWSRSRYILRYDHGESHVFSPEKPIRAQDVAAVGLETNDQFASGMGTKRCSAGASVETDLPMSIAQQVNIVRALTNRPACARLE